VDAVGESAHLAVLHGREVLYVVEERAPGRMPLVTDVGVRLPAELTASGRAVLAGLPGPQVRALFPDVTAFVDRHGVGPRTLSALRRLLVDVRRAGYASEEGEVTPGLASVAAAVHDHTGRPVAGAAVTFSSEDIDDPGRVRLARQVTTAAAELTRRIGGQAP
jgi:DNA-binding IclR family transcriptional regulator